MSSDQFRPRGAAAMASSSTSAPRPIDKPAPAQTAILQLCLRQAAEGSRAVMEVLLSDAVALANLQAAEPALLIQATNRDRTIALAQAVTLLTQHAPALCLHFPEALRRAFSTAENEAPAPKLVRSVWRVDQLELMDDAQVLMQMALARAQQSAAIDAEALLTELDALISTVQGFASVQPDFNPLRPATYISALEFVFAQIPVAPAVRLAWWQLTGPGLGKALCVTYAHAVYKIFPAHLPIHCCLWGHHQQRRFSFPSFTLHSLAQHRRKVEDSAPYQAVGGRSQGRQPCGREWLASG